MIQVAINGNRDEAYVPKTTETIVYAAIAAVQEGAGSIHFHVRDETGKETLEGHWVDEQVATLKESLSQTPIGISTGAWIEPDLTRRLEQIKSWNNLPDFVSINFDEPGYDEVTQLISAKGIQIEVGLSNLNSTLNFMNSKLKGNFLRILIEPQEKTFNSAMKTVEIIEKLLKDSKNELPILLHGVGNSCWNLLQLACEKGYLTRIGFEDTLTLPNGQQAESNAELMREANRIKANCKKTLKVKRTNSMNLQ